LLLPPGQGVSLNQWSLDAKAFESLRQAASIIDPLNPELTQFRDHGGKLMIYQGWADTLAHPQLTIDYYNAVTRAMGGTQQTDQFARLFMIPGMGHCGGGPTPDSTTMLLQMVNWVEKGQAPQSITAIDTDPVTNQLRQQPIYPYPLVSKYIGPNPAADPGGPDNPANFVPANPTVQHDDDINWLGRSWFTAPLPTPPLGYPYDT
jgi:feruloyl esterase